LAYYENEQNFTYARRTAIILADAILVSAHYQHVAGQLCFKDGLLEDSIRYLNKALELQPQNTDVLLDATRVYFRMNSHAEAKAMLEKVLAINPTHEDAKQMLESVKVPSSFEEGI
jgi:tetratricopeptide (TPR) repeat protein